MRNWKQSQGNKIRTTASATFKKLCKSKPQQKTLKMEFKVRKESETMMEKVFRRHARRGGVRTEKIADMLKELRDDIEIPEMALSEAIGHEDRDGEGRIGLEQFNRIAMQFLIRQARRDSDPFIHKHEIHVEELPGGFKPHPKQEKFTMAARSAHDMDPFGFKNEIHLEDFSH